MLDERCSLNLIRTQDDPQAWVRDHQADPGEEQNLIRE